MAGPSAASPRPEWLRVSGPRPGHSAGFLFCRVCKGRSKTHAAADAQVTPALVARVTDRLWQMDDEVE